MGRKPAPAAAPPSAATTSSPSEAAHADSSTVTSEAPATASALRPAPSAQGAAVVAPPSGAITPSPLAVTAANVVRDKPAPRTVEPAPPRREPEAAPAPALAPAPAPTRALPAYALADARRLGREFVTLLNQRRAREVALFTAMGGDAAVRAELLKLTESATDFAAGFDRVPGAPEEWANGFATEFHLDLEWRGGTRVMRIRLFASPADGGWRTVGFAADLP
mgnify:CR=1 FL=1